MAGIFLAIYGLGIVMTRLPREIIIRGSMYNLHKSLGVVILALLLLRVLTLLQVYRGKYFNRKPKATTTWLRNVLLHTLLYGLMLVVPVSGIWLSNSAGRPIPLFFFKLPGWFPTNPVVTDFARDMHFWLAYMLLTLVAAHGLVQHKYVLKQWKKWTKGFSQLGERF
ncbi:cytochrome b [Leptolyngbya sp. AN02str]|uniref:cytochrome b n=1 Tax=Leptolyngbya sp. AN02str TaxID=3423363 RepID=UPI003D316A8E